MPDSMLKSPIRRTGPVMAALFGLTLTANPSLAAGPCDAIFQKAQTMAVDHTAADWEALYREAVAATDCDAAFLTELGRKVAVSITREVEKDLARGAAQATVEQRVEASLAYHRLWQALAYLGDIAADDKRYEQAVRRYDEALAQIAEIPKSEQGPPETAIAAIFKKAEEARLLSSDYVPSSRSRAGDPVGLAAPSIRGFVPKRVAVPVTFGTDSTAFTQNGEKAARDMLEYLDAQGSPDIELVGHTDERGADAYNLDLSLKRAEALQTYLADNHYDGHVAATGKGEAEPFRPDNPDRYTQEELWQMDRRVELVRKAGQ